MAGRSMNVFMERGSVGPMHQYLRPYRYFLLANDSRMSGKIKRRLLCSGVVRTTRTDGLACSPASSGAAAPWLSAPGSSHSCRSRRTYSGEEVAEHNDCKNRWQKISGVVQYCALVHLHTHTHGQRRTVKPRRGAGKQIPWRTQMSSGKSEGKLSQSSTACTVQYSGQHRLAGQRRSLNTSV